MEGDAGSGENVQIHQVKDSEKPWVRRTGEQLYDKLHPEVTRLRESLPWIDELQLPRKALEWIGQCKDLSDEEKNKDQNGDIKTGFDLIKVHLLMQRELKMVREGKIDNRKRGRIREEIEKDLDDLLTYMMRDKETWRWKLPKDISHYLNGDTIALKGIALTKLLGQWHQFGDENFALRRVGALPIKKRAPPSAAERVFLDKLQNIDRPEYWKGEGGRYEKYQMSRTTSYYTDHEEYKHKARSNSR